MRFPDNIREVSDLVAPDFMGFIFYPPSPRFVPKDMRLPGELADGVQRVGVFVNQEFEEIKNKIIDYRLHYIQLHGDENPQFCIQLRQESVGVIKAFSVGEQFDFDLLQPYLSAVDYFLFDTKGAYRGGNGKSFDWRILKKYPYDIPIFLSGGITEDHLKELHLLEELPIVAIDVNSRFEDRPGWKNESKLRSLKEALK